MRGRKRKPVSEQELEFQAALSDYRNGNKKALDIIWIRVYEACKAKIACYYKGIPNLNFHDRVLDATEKVMRYITENGANPRILGKYVAWPCYGSAYSKKAVQEDSELSYEVSIENGYDIAIDINGDIEDEQ